jgi:hypothetical protein
VKVSTVIKFLQEFSKPDDEVFIQWWTQKDVESAMGDVTISGEVFEKAVDIWDNEPIGARDAGVLECVFAAKEVIKEQRKKENAEKFRLITGGS